MKTSAWASVPDLVDVLRRRWQRYLKDYACGSDWQPVVLPVRGPAARDVLDRFEDVRRWTADFEAQARGRFEVEYRQVAGRHLGSNRVPARVRVARFEDLCAILGTGAEVSVLTKLLLATASRLPQLEAWARERPGLVLDNREVWERVLATAEWMSGHDRSRLYLRQVDVEGVDTKFVEKNQRLLADMLTTLLPKESVGPAGFDFARHFGFRAKPAYTRFRFLDQSLSPLPPTLTELTVRTDELARLDLHPRTVFVVENEVTYLALPAIPAALALFGSGFAAAGLSRVPWLSNCEVVYWGDIDTHGFDILSRLRRHLPEARSLLMDRATLLSHRAHWSTEDSPARRALSGLTDTEQTLYQDLVGEVYGYGVRLEQERIRFSDVKTALERWSID